MAKNGNGNGEAANGESYVTLRDYMEALRKADDKFDSERDLRYREVQAEREKALVLGREVQALKDEKANNLRSQIEGERGTYASKDDLTAAIDRMFAAARPAMEYESAQRGSKAITPQQLVAAVGFLVLVLGAAAAFVTFVGR